MNLLAVQGTLRNLLQHHSSKASVLRYAVFFMVLLSHPYMTAGKTIALARQPFVRKVTSLLFNMLLRLRPTQTCLAVSRRLVDNGPQGSTYRRERLIWIIWGL